MGLENLTAAIPSAGLTLTTGLNEGQISSMEKVFNNNLLLEEILKKVIFSKDVKTSKKMVPTLRLINKSWLLATSSALKKSGNKLIIPIQKDDFTQTQFLLPNIKYDVNGSRKGLDRFVATFGISGRLEHSFLPLKLNLADKFFRAKNWQNLANCLTKLRNEMCELRITFPKDGGSMPLIFPPFELPFLRKLSFHLSGKKNRKAVWLLQLIMNASSGLKELVLLVPSEDLIPVHFEFVRLPPSLLSLNWELPLNSQSLKFVLTNPFPNLTKFTIRQTDTTDNDMLFEILHHFRKTLKYFCMSRKYACPTSSEIYFSFPLMEKLECIEISCAECNFDPKNIASLQTFLPQLKQIDLIQQTKPLLAKWIQSSTFENVETLRISLLEGTFQPARFHRSVNLDMIEQVHTAFPNVTRLTLTVNVRKLEGLKYVFRYMQQLKSLFIIFVRDDNNQNISTHLLESVLLGIPKKLVKALAEDPDLHDSVVLQQNTKKSILNLPDLKALTLLNKTTCFLIGPVFGAGNDGWQTISELLFNEGFLKMPKLRQLKFSDYIKVPSEMIEVWKGQGRMLEIDTGYYTDQKI